MHVVDANDRLYAMEFDSRLGPHRRRRDTPFRGGDRCPSGVRGSLAGARTLGRRAVPGSSVNATTDGGRPDLGVRDQPSGWGPPSTVRDHRGRRPEVDADALAMGDLLVSRLSGDVSRGRADKASRHRRGAQVAAQLRGAAGCAVGPGPGGIRRNANIPVLGEEAFDIPQSPPAKEQRRRKRRSRSQRDRSCPLTGAGARGFPRNWRTRLGQRGDLRLRYA